MVNMIIGNSDKSLSLKERIDKYAVHADSLFGQNRVKFLPPADVIYGLFFLLEDLSKDEKEDEDNYGKLYWYLDNEGFYNLNNRNNIVDNIYNLMIEEKLVKKTDLFMNTVAKYTKRKFSHESIFEDMSKKFANERLLEKFINEMDDLALVDTLDLDKILKKNHKKITLNIMNILDREGYDFFTKRVNGFIPYELMPDKIKNKLKDYYPAKCADYERDCLLKNLKEAKAEKTIKKRI